MIWITTMWIELPEIADPDLSTELVTITAMNAGRGPDGGGAELPGAVTQLTPQAGVRGARAKPLKLRESFPAPVRLFWFHCAPQNTARSPIPACWAPMTKLPPPGANENPIVLQDVLATLPPTSLIAVAMVNRPTV